MNPKNLLLAGLAGGLVSLALTNIPAINFVNCLLCAGFWAGPLLAVWVYRRLQGPVTLGQAVVVGLVAGVWSGAIGLLLSVFGLAGLAGVLNSYRPFLPADAIPDLEQTAPGWAVWVFNVIGVGVDLAFGALGGLLGGALFRAKPAAPAA